MKRLSTFIGLLGVLLFFSCHRPKNHEELVKMFQQHKPTLDSLIERLKSDKKLDSLFNIDPYTGLPDIKKSYPAEFNMLNQVGITDASSHKCNKIKSWYYLKTNWPSDYPIFLVYTPCDSLKTVTSFYEKDKYSNEWWGLGENWQMFKFLKTIDYVKF
jgi:hypothetical protein